MARPVTARSGQVGGLRAAGAAVAALVLVVVLMIATNQLLVADWHALAVGTAAFSAITLALAALWHTLGGFACAAMTRDSYLAAVELVILGFAMMAGSVINTWSTVPPWYSAAMLVIAPAFLWAGSRLHQMRALTRRPAA